MGEDSRVPMLVLMLVTALAGAVVGDALRASAGGAHDVPPRAAAFTMAGDVRP